MEVILKSIYAKNEQHFTQTVLSLVESAGISTGHNSGELELMQLRITSLEKLVTLLIEQQVQPASFIKAAGLVPYDTELVRIK